MQPAPPGPGTAVSAGIAAAAGWRRAIPSWPLIAGLLFFARLLAARAALLNDPDTYLHIAAGRWMLAHGAVPARDPFSHSMPGAVWISSERGAQLVLAAAYDLLGWNGIVVLSAASAAVALGLLTHFLLHRLAPLPGLVAVAAAAALLEPHILARPHVLALPVLVLWSALLLAARDAERRPPFAALPLMALWANLHGSFLFGLALAAFLAGEAVLRPSGGRSRLAEARLWGGFVLGAAAAALLTPHGIAGIIEPLRLMAMPALQSTFIEWRSPDFQHAPEVEFWVLGAVFVGFATAARPPWTRLVLLLGLIHMTLQHVRHADVLALVGPLAIAGSLAAATRGGTADSAIGRWFASLARPATLPGIAATAALAAAFALPLTLHPIVRGDDAVTPQSALAAAQRLQLAGPVLNSEAFGGYLIFRGVPTFVDGRIEMYGNNFLAEDVAAERGDPAALQRILARYRIGWALLASQSGAAREMDHLPGWRQVYRDRYAAVFRRLDPPDR